MNIESTLEFSKGVLTKGVLSKGVLPVQKKKGNTNAGNSVSRTIRTLSLEKSLSFVRHFTQGTRV